MLLPSLTGGPAPISWYALRAHAARWSAHEIGSGSGTFGLAPLPSSAPQAGQTPTVE